MAARSNVNRFPFARGFAFGFDGYIDILQQVCPLGGGLNDHAGASPRVIAAFELDGLFRIDGVFRLVVVQVAGLEREPFRCLHHYV